VLVLQEHGDEHDQSGEKHQDRDRYGSNQHAKPAMSVRNQGKHSSTPYGSAFAPADEGRPIERLSPWIYRDIDFDLMQTDLLQRPWLEKFAQALSRMMSSVS
jgi:hypothetical protein